MKFTPRVLQKNVNISQDSPLKELVFLLAAVVGGLIVIYIVLGFALDILVENMPPELEEKTEDFFSNKYKWEESSPAAEKKIQELLDDLVKYLPEQDLHYTVHVYDSPDVNAVALPGRNILVFSGLLKEIGSENELSMILAHELGHFAHRDHLKGLGRGLVLVFISSVLFGTDSAVADFTQKTLVTTDLNFSRQQEIAADVFALELLSRKYGHVGGACDFFTRIKGKQKLPRFGKFFVTHPFPVDRINLLKKEIKRSGYLTKDTIALDSSYWEGIE